MKDMLVKVVVDSNLTGTELVVPTSMTVLPRPAWMHSGTAMAKASELVTVGYVLSATQTRMTWVALPWLQLGVQVKTPSGVILPGPSHNVNVSERLVSQPRMVTTSWPPAKTFVSEAGSRQIGAST